MLQRDFARDQKKLSVFHNYGRLSVFHASRRWTAALLASYSIYLSSYNNNNICSPVSDFYIIIYNNVSTKKNEGYNNNIIISSELKNK